MHHWAQLRKYPPSIRRLLPSQIVHGHRISSSTSPNSGLGGGEKNRGSSSSNWVDVGSISTGLVVIGSSLGLCNWYSVSDKDSILCFADSGQENGKPKKTPKFIFGEAYRRKVFFKYEKRIRMTSPPEKVNDSYNCTKVTVGAGFFVKCYADLFQVFEYFASIRTAAGEVLMTPADLMRAIVPVFPPSESNRVREGSLQGEKTYGVLHCPPSNFFMLFDTNNDGLISFAEYIFFVTLLSIPESSFSVAFKMFDLDNNGEIDKEEFKRVMALMRTHNRQGAQHRDGLRIGLKVSGSVEDGGLLEYFFGKDGNECLRLERFVQFLRDLHAEITHLEFAHYDYKSQGCISSKDFAMSMVASADMSLINKFLDRVEELNEEPNLRRRQITFEEFKSFSELRKRLKPLSMAIFTHGTVNGELTKPDFKRAAHQVCGIALTDSVVDLIFFVFDTNRDGRLSSDEFLRVMQRREKNTSLPREPGLMGLFSCWLECTNC